LVCGQSEQDEPASGKKRARGEEHGDKDDGDDDDGDKDDEEDEEGQARQEEKHVSSEEGVLGCL
jgi:hypothetical protein